MAFYGVGLDIKVKELNMQFKMYLQRRGGVGIRSLARIFKRFDFNGNGMLDIMEFEEALGQFGLFPSKVELQALMKFYDVNKDGNVTYEEFLSGLKDPLTDRMTQLVMKAFAIMDKDGSGEIQVNDIKDIYDVTKHPDFIEGRKSKEEILEDFLNEFDSARGNDDGTVTKEEWLNYYSDLAMSTPTEEYFCRMIEQVWCISEDEGSVAYNEQISEFVSQIRLRLLTMSNESTEEFVLRKIFANFDSNDSGTITIDELAAMIASLKLSCERKFLFGIFKVIDTNNSGGIEFEEFCRYIINDPYK